MFGALALFGGLAMLTGCTLHDAKEVGKYNRKIEAQKAEIKAQGGFKPECWPYFDKCKKNPEIAQAVYDEAIKRGIYYWSANGKKLMIDKDRLHEWGQIYADTLKRYFLAHGFPWSDYECHSCTGCKPTF